MTQPDHFFATSRIELRSPMRYSTDAIDKIVKVSLLIPTDNSLIEIKM